MNKLMVIIATLLIILLGIGTFFDFQIASRLLHEGGGFMTFFYYVTPVIFATIMVMSAALVCFCIDYKNIKKWKILLIILGSIPAWVFGIAFNFTYFGISGVILSIITFICVFIISRKMSAELKEKYFRVGISIIIIAVGGIFLIEWSKAVWGRVRFRSMQDDLEMFSHWWVILGGRYYDMVPARNEILSFPSGHSQWGATTMVLSLLCLVNPKWQSKEKIVFLFGIFIGFMTMLSRLFQGAHFLSDVAVGTGVALFLFFICRKYIVLKNDKLLQALLFAGTFLGFMQLMSRLF